MDVLNWLEGRTGVLTLLTMRYLAGRFIQILQEFSGFSDMYNKLSRKCNLYYWTSTEGEGLSASVRPPRPQKHDPCHCNSRVIIGPGQVFMTHVRFASDLLHVWLIGFA